MSIGKILFQQTNKEQGKQKWKNHDEKKIPVNEALENDTLVICIKMLLLCLTDFQIYQRGEKYFNEFGRHPAAQY